MSEKGFGLTHGNPLEPWEKHCRKIIKNPNWHGILFERIRGGVSVTGAECPLYERGPRKGKPNYNRADEATRRTIFIPGAKA